MPATSSPSTQFGRHGTRVLTALEVKNGSTRCATVTVIGATAREHENPDRSGHDAELMRRQARREKQGRGDADNPEPEHAARMEPVT